MIAFAKFIICKVFALKLQRGVFQLHFWFKCFVRKCFPVLQENKQDMVLQFFEVFLIIKQPLKDNQVENPWKHICI